MERTPCRYKKLIRREPHEAKDFIEKLSEEYMNSTNLISEHVLLSISLTKVSVTENKIHFKTGKQVTFPFLKNTEKAGKPARGQDPFQQKIEPAGRYLLHDVYPKLTKPPGWETGTLTFKNPLVIPFNTKNEISYNENSWKVNLSKAFNNKKLKTLSKAIRKSGYDGIVTVLDNETKEIVDLSMF